MIIGLSIWVFVSISKAKTVKRTVLQTDNFFQAKIKKKHLLYVDTDKSFRNLRELNWTSLLIFSKRNIFLEFKTTIIFLISFFSFERVRYFWFKLCNFFSKLLPATNQQLFCVTESDIGQGPSNHTPLLYELLVFSSVTCIKLW